MGADMRYMASDARVGQPEIKLGLIPGAGGTQRLTRLVGLPKARDIVYTGRFVAADEALSIGLADKVVPPDELFATAMCGCGGPRFRPNRGAGGGEASSYRGLGKHR